MKRNFIRSCMSAFCLIILIFSACTLAQAETRDLYVVSYFEPPGAGPNGAPNGLAWDGQYLWLTDTMQYKIFQLTTSGEVVSSFNWPYGGPQGPQGLTWDGNYLWNVSPLLTYIYRFTTEGGGEPIFQLPGPWPVGLAFDGAHLWLSDGGTTWGDGRIYELTTDGDIVSWFHLPADISIPRDLAYDGAYLWLAEQRYHKIYKITTTGDIIASYDVNDIGASGNPYGLTFDGEFLWLSTESALIDGRTTDAVYKIAFNPWVLNLTEIPYSGIQEPYNSTGAASSQMILNYIRLDTGLPALSQNEIYEYAKNPDPPEGELNPDQIDKALGHFDPYDYLITGYYDQYDGLPDGNPFKGYNFSVDYYDPNTNPNAINDYMRDICHWMAYLVKQKIDEPGGELVARPNTPAAIPIFGSYDRWVVVKGFIASTNPCPDQNQPWYSPDFTVYGFWIKDPRPDGIGQNTYKTAAESESTYFQPLVTNDAYNGLFVQIAEPPLVRSEAKVNIAKPRTNLANREFVGAQAGTEVKPGLSAKKYSWKDLVDSYLLKDAEAVAAFEGSLMREPILVKRLDKENSNYYLVPFDKPLGKKILTSAVIIIDAQKGYFKEASWTQIPEKFLKVNREQAINLTEEYARAATNNCGLASAELSWEPNGYSSSPYEPYWKVDISGHIWYVTQKGEVISG